MSRREKHPASRRENYLPSRRKNLPAGRFQIRSVKSQLRGQALVEFAAAAVVLVPLFVGTVFLGLILIGGAWLKTNSFAIARARLYGQNQDCRGSSASVTESSLYEFKYHCEPNGAVKASLLSEGHEVLQYHWNLVEALR